MNASELPKLLACPVCQDGELLGVDEQPVDGLLRCSRCHASYPVRGGIPILLPPGLDPSQVEDELDHAYAHKRQQTNYFDRELAEEFEINRPHATALAYQWLMAEKFCRSVASLPPLAGATVIDACCGSGMDAEFLVREGARVIALDISEGCASRARVRAQRYGLDCLVVVGDVEHLPIRTAAVDIGYVHDGLHHLDEPALGLRELARVARCAVSVNEPADALGTQVAVRLGISSNRESAGNRVVRLGPKDVCRELELAGFRARARRYFMYYKHEPGRVMHFASRPGVYHLYRWAMEMANLGIGRWGNKLQVTAVRTD
jgi:SAM-dependent methyltransferase